MMTRIPTALPWQFRLVASAGSCSTDRPHCATSPQASHRALPGPRSMFQDAENLINEQFLNCYAQRLPQRIILPARFAIGCETAIKVLKLPDAVGNSLHPPHFVEPCQHQPTSPGPTLGQKGSPTTAITPTSATGMVQRCNSVRGDVNSLANAGWSCAREQIRHLSSGSKSAL